MGEMIENNELFVFRVTSIAHYSIRIEDFFDNVHCGDFRKNDNFHVHCGDFSTFSLKLRKYVILKSPQCAAQSWDFGHTLV